MSVTPTTTIGILGGGQLGRMLALAAAPLGVRCVSVDPAPQVPASDVCFHLRADFGSPEALELLRGAAVVTYEFENVPAEVGYTLLQHGIRVAPNPEALAVAQDRVLEKACFAELGIPSVPNCAIDSDKDLAKALAQVGFKAVLKTRTSGYDGKGQRVVHNLAEAQTAYAELHRPKMIAEGFLPFDRELSILSVRSLSGAIAHYPLVQNHHREGILRVTQSPAPNVTPQLQARAEAYSNKLLERLNYVGVLALELFEKDGELYANEIAPRVHNSGHFSIEGSKTSQFENHLRAILGLPLGSTEPRCPSVMLNVIGNMCPLASVLEVPDAHLHLYGKEPRNRRKIGHITMLGDGSQAFDAQVTELRAVVEAHADG